MKTYLLYKDNEADITNYSLGGRICYAVASCAGDPGV